MQLFWSSLFQVSDECGCLNYVTLLESGRRSALITQSKSKIQITRSVHCKFNCITVSFNGTQRGIFYIEIVWLDLFSPNYHAWQTVFIDPLVYISDVMDKPCRHNTRLWNTPYYYIDCCLLFIQRLRVYALAVASKLIRPTETERKPYGPHALTPSRHGWIRIGLTFILWDLNLKQECKAPFNIVHNYHLYKKNYLQECSFQHKIIACASKISFYIFIKWNF